MPVAKHTNKSVNDKTKCCLSCGEEICSTAKKCIHCNDYQDWRRFFPMSPLVLSLVATLVSVAGITVPIFVDLTKHHNSDFQISFQTADDKELSVLVANTGDRPGSLLGAILVVNTDLIHGKWYAGVVPGSASIPTFDLVPITSSGQAAMYIKPGVIPITLSSSQKGTRQIVLHTDWGEIDNHVPHALRPPMHCRLTMTFANFDGTRSYPAIDSPCYPYARFLDAHAEATDRSGIKGPNRSSAVRWLEGF